MIDSGRQQAAFSCLDHHFAFSHLNLLKPPSCQEPRRRHGDIPSAGFTLGTDDSP